MAELPRWALTSTEKLNEQRRMRFGLRRSLEMHRWLALGVALAGAALAAVYLLVFWPSATTGSRTTDVALTTCAIFVAGVALGIAAAVIAHNLDPRIYISSDIRHLLGIAPIAQLPDFSEISTAAAQEHVAAFAKELAQGCGEEGVRRCVFTGTGIGVGVTTIAVRTKDALKSTGRAALLVDAAWATPGTGPGMGDATDESGSRSDSLIVTDTSPLAESPDTEFLTRFADCVIVVVESGVTTREQLKATVDCLKRLNVAAVGFVVNRVRQVQSGSALREMLKARRSLADGQSVGTRKQFTAAVQRALADAPKVAGGLPGKPAAKPFKRSTALMLVKRPQQPADWSKPGIPPWLTEALTKLDAAAPQVAHEAPMQPAAQQTTKGTPEAEKSTENEAEKTKAGQVSSDVHSDGNASQQERSGAMLFEMNWRAPQPETIGGKEPGEVAPNIPAALASKKPSRISALRGKVSAANLRSLNHLRQSEIDPGGLPEALVDALKNAPGRPGSMHRLVTPIDLKDLKESRTPPVEAAGEAAEGESQAEWLRAQSSHAASEGEAARAEKPAEVQASIPVSDAARSAEAQSIDGGFEVKEKAEEVPSKPPAGSAHDRRAEFGDVQILPSKRGQYRRKKD